MLIHYCHLQRNELTYHHLIVFQSIVLIQVTITNTKVMFRLPMNLVLS